MTDDQPYHTVNYMPTVKGKLMADGIVFENGFATTPLCCPSRSSILTGKYAHNHEVYTNRPPLGGAQKFDDSFTLAVWLQSIGYQTAYYGKYLNEYEALDPNGHIPPGWDEWSAFLGKNIGPEDSGSLQFYFNFSMGENGTAVEYPRSKDNFSADVVTQKAINFINQAHDNPFLMFVSYYNPHSPYVSAPRHRETFRANTDWDWIQYRPPNFNEENIKDKPAYIGELSPLSPEEIDTAHKQILRSLLSVDDGVATILDMLEQTSLSENTIIIFISDNGLTLGDHRFGATKNCPYEACILIPFIVYAPGIYTPHIDTHLVANIDLAPTIAELAGAPIPNSVNGESMVSLLENPAAEWRDEILLEHWPTEEGVGSMIPEFYSIRTAEWKYTEYVTGEAELYDLVNDPYELVNLAGKSDYSDIEAELKVKLEKLKQE
jgi:arylsulfatase A-like enzyme